MQDINYCFWWVLILGMDEYLHDNFDEQKDVFTSFSKHTFYSRTMVMKP